MTVSRRRLLTLAAAGVAAVAAQRVLAAVAVGGEADYAGETVVSGYVTVRGDWTVDSLEVAPGGVMVFDPDGSVTLQSRGNVIVRGLLRMRPSCHTVTHRLRFVDVDESRMVGGGMEPLPTDVGLWVMHDGVLDAAGTPRAGWNRTGTDPTWQAGDELMVAPQAVGEFRSFAPFTGTLPTVPGPNGPVASEVFNLTRNVIIGGTPTGRAHVMFMMPMQPVTLSHVRVEHVGPRQADPDNPGKTRPVLGRYGLHVHKAGDNTRGSLIEGVVVVGSGSRSFVPHASHGVTLRDCVSYDSSNEAFWWDRDDATTGGVNATRGTLYEHCGAFKVGPKSKAEKGGSQGKLSAFLLGQGGTDDDPNTVRDSVAVGVWNDGAQQSAGFYWDENANLKPNRWVYERNVAHNVERIGNFVWQNDPRFLDHHVLDGMVAYRCGDAGYVHGAYSNTYVANGALLFGNGQPAVKGDTQLEIHSGRHNRFTDFSLDGQGRSDSCLFVSAHQAAAQGDPLYVERAALTGFLVAPVIYNSSLKPGWMRFVACTVDGRDLEPSDFRVTAMVPGDVCEVQRRDGSAYRLNPDGTAQSIPAFA